MRAAFHSISVRLAVVVGLALAVGLLLHVVVSMRHHEDALVKLKREEANLSSDIIKDSLVHAMLQGRAGRDTIRNIVTEIGKRKEIARVRIFDAVGRIHYSTVPGETGTTVNKEAENCKQCHATDEPLKPSGITDRSRFFYTPSEKGNSEYRVLGLINPIYNNKECTPCHQDQTVLGVLDVVVSMRSLDEEIRGHRRMLGVAGGLGILLVIGVVWLVVRFMVQRPVAALLDGTRKVGTLNLSHRIPADRQDELGNLARAFNAMTERLERAREEIRDFAEQLEEKVQLKTAELASAQRQMVRTEKMAAIGQMAAGVAHEINNPLTGVITFAHLLRRKFPEDSEEVGDLDTIIVEAQRCSKIARDLLEFARPRELVISEVDIAQIIERTLAVVEHQPIFHNITVNRSYASDLPRISLDQDRIEQVILNLVMNAAEAMENGGTLGISTNKETDRRAIRITVEDTGPGIDPEIQNRIFDPFFSTKDVGAGTGLGLSVSYRIVEDHGGRIRVVSEPGKGTRFTVILPIRGEVDG